jgi:hypothetical protein
MTQPSTDPKKVAAQAVMMKFLSQKPEPLISQLDRFGIEWDKIKQEDGTYLFQMKWSDLAEFERKLQTEPTLLEKMAEDMKGNPEFMSAIGGL